MSGTFRGKYHAPRFPDKLARMVRSSAAPKGPAWATNSGGNSVMHFFRGTMEFVTHDVYSVLTKTPGFAEGRGGKLGKIDSATGRVAEYDVPSP